MFDRIAHRYELTNELISLGMHRYWLRQLIRLIKREHKRNLSHRHQSLTSIEGDRLSVIDLCAGSGSVARALLESSLHIGTMTLVDFSAQMLQLARKKLGNSPYHKKIRSYSQWFTKDHARSTSKIQVRYIESDATKTSIESESAHLITMAYGLRNLPDSKMALQECLRLLKPGGALSVLELTRPALPFISHLYRYYIKHIMPRLGGWMSGDRQAYDYLTTSVQHFPDPQIIEAQMHEVGFTHIRMKKLSFGTVHIFYGERPL